MIQPPKKVLFLSRCKVKFNTYCEINNCTLIDISNLRSPEVKNQDLKSAGDITADRGFIPPEIRYTTMVLKL